MTGRQTLLLLLLPAMLLYPQSKMRGPEAPAMHSHAEEYGQGKNPFINFYQHYISAAAGNNKCPMYPTCSQFAKIAFDSLPWYQAYWKTCDRLLRCGKELYYYESFMTANGVKWRDPLKNNVRLK